jgi:hypothetical protein
MSSTVGSSTWAEIVHHASNGSARAWGYEWRNDCIIPRYGSAGVQKFAFHTPAGFPGTIEAGSKEAIDGPAIFPTAWFSGRSRATEWLKSP